MDPPLQPGRRQLQRQRGGTAFCDRERAAALTKPELNLGDELASLFERFNGRGDVATRPDATDLKSAIGIWPNEANQTSRLNAFLHLLRLNHHHIIFCRLTIGSHSS